MLVKSTLLDTNWYKQYDIASNKNTSNKWPSNHNKTKRRRIQRGYKNEYIIYIIVKQLKLWEENYISGMWNDKLWLWEHRGRASWMTMELYCCVYLAQLIIWPHPRGFINGI